jgi:hypothetical protein
MMKISCFSIIALSGFVLCAVLGADEAIHVPKAKYIFSPAASPSGKFLAVSISERLPEGEVTSGFPTLLGMDHNPILVERLSASESQDTDTPPRWTSDSSRLFFITVTGIQSMSVETHKTSILRRGSFAGLSISSDDSKLAFWNLAPAQEHSYTLVVVDLASNTEVRSWSVPNNYEADQYGFEVAFAADNRSLFARTYDTEGRTPLKEFSLTSDRVTEISGNCSGLAYSKDAIYFIGSNDRGPSLRKIGRGDGQPKETASVFPYDDLMASGTQRWLVARELRTRKWALVDTINDRIQTVEGKCDSLTVLADGEILYFKKGDISTSVSVCSTGGARLTR